MHERGRGRERGRQRTRSTLCADRIEPYPRLEHLNHEILTQPDVGHATNLATQALQEVLLYSIICPGTLDLAPRESSPRHTVSVCWLSDIVHLKRVQLGGKPFL